MAHAHKQKGRESQDKTALLSPSFVKITDLPYCVRVCVYGKGRERGSRKLQFRARETEKEPNANKYSRAKIKGRYMTTEVMQVFGKASSVEVVKSPPTFSPLEAIVIWLCPFPPFSPGPSQSHQQQLRAFLRSIVVCTHCKESASSPSILLLCPV